VSGNNVKATQYKDIVVTRCGSRIPGAVSASYSLNRNIETIFARGKRDPIASYGVLPDISISYSSYEALPFDTSEANSFSTIVLSGVNGSVAAGYCLLSSYSFELSVDSYLNIQKTFNGFVKPSASGKGGPSNLPEPLVVKRQDYSGGLPPGISNNHLQKISGSIEIDRQTISQFATRKPYASVVNFPIRRSITYEVITDGMDSLVLDDLESACKNIGSQTYNVGVSACGFSFDISKAFLTSIDYSGGDASSTSGYQTASITYTSYEDIPGIKPVIIFNNESGC